MSGNYQPASDAQPDDYRASLLLAYRDIVGKAPIDKVGYPSVHITPACFGNGTFDNDEFQTCFSNLLAIEYRHFIFDIYWDTRNQYFTFCPVQLPEIAVNGTSTSTQAASTSSSSLQASSTESSSIITNTTGSSAAHLKRQSTASSDASSHKSSTSSPSVTSKPSSSTTDTQTSVPSTTDAAGEVLFEYGPYECSNDLTLDSLTDVYTSWVRYTADPVQVRLVIFQFNLHAAASLSNPRGPAPTPAADDMPNKSELLGAQLDSSLDKVIYTPGQLIQDRQNLNESWLNVDEAYRLPMLGYYNTFPTSHGNIATDDGWPSEDYLSFTKLKQLILTWGTIDSQMKNYDFAADSNLMFPSDYLYKTRNYQANAAGRLTSGCIYDANSDSVSRVNNTWTMATVNDPVDAVNDDMVRNITACGLAPSLNTTLDNASAAQDYMPYLDLQQATIFGWAPGNPKNITGNSTEGQYRCAVIDSSDAYQGQWRLANCKHKYRAACRVGDQPYGWSLSTAEATYEDASSACGSGTSFDVPRTGLENTYLYHRILSDNQTKDRDYFLSNIWINLNDLDTDNCWVVAGANASCPYQRSDDEIHDRDVLIPTIAALIVLILTGLTILVKCNNNYYRSKHHRTGPGGWEYEGVPS